MTLHIIGGQWRGRKLVTLPTQDTRPTANRTREALFNILAPKIRDAHIFDIFAGSGALGLEALSRGADRVVFLDSDPKACAVIEKNIIACKAQSDCELCCCKLTEFNHWSWNFSLVLMDPPYGKGMVDTALAYLAAEKLPAPGATIVAEHETGFTPKFDVALYTLLQSRVYGKATLSFFEYSKTQV